MYSVLCCHVRIRAGWHSVDVSELSVRALKTNYNKSRLFIEDGAGIKYVVDINDIYKHLPYNVYDTPVTAWITTLDPRYVKDALDYLTLDDVGHMVCRDLWDLPVIATLETHVEDDGSVAAGRRNSDMVLTLKAEDPALLDRLHSNSLITVNGRVVTTKRQGSAIYCINAKRHIDSRRSEMLTSTVIDLTQLGTVYKVPITNDNLEAIPRNDYDRQLGQTRLMLTTDIELSNKATLLSLDGYLHIMDSNIYMHDTHHVIITVSHRLICRRLLEDGPTNWASVNGITIMNTGIDMDNIDALAYTVSGDSSLIVIDNDDVNIHYRPIGRTDILGTYTYPYPPQGILQLENGSMADYRIDGWDGDTATVNISGGIRRYPVDSTVGSTHKNMTTLTGISTDKPTPMGGRIIDLYTTIPK